MVQLDDALFVRLQLWGIWAAYNIAYRGVFGYWSSRQHKWWREVRARLGWGLPEYVGGTYRLLMFGLVPISMAVYQLAFDACNARGIYFSTLCIAWAALILDMAWEELLYDRKDGNAALVLTLMSAGAHVAWIVLLTQSTDCSGGTDDWARWMALATAGVRLLYVLYHAYGMSVWVRDPQRKVSEFYECTLTNAQVKVGGLSRKEQRERPDIARRAMSGQQSQDPAALRRSILK